MPSSRVQTLEKQLAAQRADLASLHADIDRAADAGDKALIAQLQAEVGPAGVLIASTERRLAAALADESDEAKAARKSDNLKTAAAFKRELDAQCKLAAPLTATVAKLAEQIEAIQASGNKAREALAGLTRQLPPRQREQMYPLLDAAGARETLGAVLADLLGKHGVFTDRAPNPGIRLGRHEFPPVDEFFAKRADNLGAHVRRIVEQVNEAI